MKTFTFLTAAALVAIANPAQAQLLGGGLGGVLGGAGSVARTLPSMPAMPPIGSSTVGSATGSGQASTSQSVNRRSGQVQTSGSASGQGSGAVGQTVTGPLGNLAGGAAGSGQASGSGSANAQLIGTDAVRGAVQGVRGTAGQTVGTVRDSAGNTVQGVRNQAGSALGGLTTASGSANGNAAGLLDVSGNNLALAGSAAGDSAGAFEVKPGTKLFDANGERIGKVRQVIADSEGHVQALVVKVDDATATLPATAFDVDGKALVSAMGEGQIKSIAASQASDAEGQTSASGK